jgi:hypothetical protein
MNQMEKKELLELTLKDLMGNVLDRVRSSEISDRACIQMEKNIKKAFNSTIKYFTEELLDIHSTPIEPIKEEIK